MIRHTLSFLASLGLVAGLATGDRVAAATILGQVSFTGTGTMNAPLATATAFTSFSNVQVDDGAGDYDVPTLVPLNTAVTIVAFSFAPLSASVAPLWSFTVGSTDYALDLSTLSISRTTLGPNTFLSLSGTGMARVTGFDATPADFTLSAQQAVGAVGTTVTFSVENVVPSLSVPEPGVALLWGVAVVTGACRRRRTRS